MSASSTSIRTSSRARTGVLCAVLVLATSLSGCSLVAKGIAHEVEKHVLHTNAAVASLSSKVQQNDATPHAVTYVTTGSAPVTVTYAVDPPHELVFATSGASTDLRLIENSTGWYACSNAASDSGSTTSSGASAKWTCASFKQNLPTNYKALEALYTGAYWVDFLKIYSTIGGLAGVTVTSKSMTVNGFALSCVVVTPSKSNGGSSSQSTWCVTSAGVLGYVQVAAKGTAFEITSYSSSTPASLFALPQGATVNSVPSGT